MSPFTPHSVFPCSLLPAPLALHLPSHVCIGLSHSHPAHVLAHNCSSCKAQADLPGSGTCGFLGRPTTAMVFPLLSLLYLLSLVAVSVCLLIASPFLSIPIDKVLEPHWHIHGYNPMYPPPNGAPPPPGLVSSLPHSSVMEQGHHNMGEVGRQLCSGRH